METGGANPLVSGRDYKYQLRHSLNKRANKRRYCDTRPRGVTGDLSDKEGAAMRPLWTASWVICFINRAMRNTNILTR